MKKTIKTLVMLILCAVVAITAVPATASAATNGTIDIKSNTVTISKGSKYQVKAVIGGITVKGQGKWKSSKPAIASVSKTGLVTAKTAGTTTVKVVYNGKSQTVKVKVVATCKHSWKTTKKATCETAGKKLCTICGKNTTIKTVDHKWANYTWEEKEGKGTPQKDVYITTCNATKTEPRDDYDYDCGTKFESRKGVGAHWKWAEANGIHMYGSCEEQLWIDIYPSYKVEKWSQTICKTCGDPKSGSIKKISTKTVNKRFTKGFNGNAMEYDEWLLIPRGLENKYVKAKESNPDLTPEKWLRTNPTETHTDKWCNEHAEWARVRTKVLELNTDDYYDPYVPVN